MKTPLITPIGAITTIAGIITTYCLGMFIYTHFFTHLVLIY